MSDMPVLIVAKSDRRRNMLKLLLEIRPGLRVVGQTSKGGSALAMVLQHRPALTILDTNIPPPGTWLTVLKQIKAESPQTQCLVLADPTQSLRAARTAGADAVLMNGFAVAKLFGTIEELLST
jgi:two-component system response regulator NreC